MKRECYLPSGQPKRRWDTRADAKAFVRDLIARGIDPEGVSPYRCSVCDYFHLGHYPSHQWLKVRHYATRQMRDGAA